MFRELNKCAAKNSTPLWCLLAIGIVYLGVMFFGHLADHLILFPTRVPLDVRGAVRKTVPFESGELEIWTAQSQRTRQQGGPDVFILRFYGNADRADRWAAIEAETWNDRAVEIWGMNYPGFGGSTGPAGLSKVGLAALAAFEELKRHATRRSAVEPAVPSGSSLSHALRTAHATARPIVVFGTSIGATAALHLAASRRSGIAGLILQNPPPLREMILRQFGWWNLWLLAGPVALQIPRDLDSIANAKTSRARAIFLLAEKDEMVAPRFHQLVVGAYAGEKRVITLRGAYHNDPIEGAALADLNAALDWLLAENPTQAQ
jgi:pimeloyl-ACP methyl ester carboxylesterase